MVQPQDFPSPIRTEFSINRDLPAVWKSVTLNRHIAAWWGSHVTLEPALNGKFRIGQNTSGVTEGEEITGVVTRIEAPHLLQFTWRASSWQDSNFITIATIALQKVDALKTHLVLLHIGWDRFPEDLGRAAYNYANTAWRTALTNLRYHAEYTSN